MGHICGTMGGMFGIMGGMRGTMGGMWDTNPQFRCNHVGRVIHNGVVNSPTGNRFVWEPPVPFEMGGRCHLLPPRTGEQGPGWDNRRGNWRR